MNAMFTYTGILTAKGAKRLGCEHFSGEEVTYEERLQNGRLYAYNIHTDEQYYIGGGIEVGRSGIIPIESQPEVTGAGCLTLVQLYDFNRHRIKVAEHWLRTTDSPSIKKIVDSLFRCATDCNTIIDQLLRRTDVLSPRKTASDDEWDGIEL